MNTKISRMNKIISCAVVMLYLFESSVIRWATSPPVPPCVNTIETPPTSQNCDCSWSVFPPSPPACKDSQYVLNGMVICVGSDFGGSSCIPSTVYIGDKYPCTTGFKAGLFTLCIAKVGICGIACALTCEAPPVCIWCFVTECVDDWGEECAPCELTSCTLSNIGIPQFGEYDSTSGTCP